ncbi:hypothetical protein H0H81_011715 [Sphagnurus paluster]|uniref:Uncharacterized protein n=1 Tax=Sphagnurus paluster TaxID=117069 RepID=A0A9P7K2A4_9AGAR|nr:hypothetical protein H0H81_011715 [Sphagnurus paluster]
MERLIVSTIEEPRENIPMDREGGKYLGTRCEIWESGAQRLYPLSSHFLEFFREHGTSPLGDPEKYCNWLLEIREKGVRVDWTWEWHAVSTRCGYHNQDAEIAYVNYTVQDLDAKRISRQDFYKKLFHVDDDYNQDRRSLTPRDGETDEE